MTSYSSISPDERAQIGHELRGKTLPLEAPTEESSAENPALAVEFSPLPDTIFRTSVAIEIHCATPEARIFYALGEEDADQNSVPFDPAHPITLTQSTAVTARAFHDGRSGPLLRGQFDVVKPAWQELEPADQSDAAPHKIGENLAGGDGWQIAAASVRGKLHAHRAGWREDSFQLAQVETSGGVWSVVAVSDGAGSALLSRVGSRLACAAAVQSLRSSLAALEDLADEQEELVARDLPTVKAALIGAGAAALRAIETEAQARDKAHSLFAATLLILLRRGWNGAQLCAGLQIGDGAIALWDGAQITLLGEADHGQSSGETRFLTTNGIENELEARVKFSIKRDLQACAVMTDGVSDDFFPEAARLGELFFAVTPMAQSAEDAGATLASWLGYEKRGSSDDRTLVLSWPGVEAAM